jgi:hypothetical protein
METADQLLQIWAAKRELEEGIGRDEDATGWLLNAIEPFSKRDLASAIGALHLMPINMERAVRLHRLAHVCAAAPVSSGQPTITLNRLRQIANAEQLDGLTTLEDPFESPFSEHFGFNDEDFVLLNGPVESETFVLGLLLDSISASREISNDFRSTVILGVTSLLRMSTLVAERAGLTADMLGAHGTRRVETPSSSADLRTLQMAVTIDKSSFVALGVDHRVIERFTTQPASTDALTCMAEKCDFSSPFLDAGDDVIVLQPTAITFALIQFIIAEARDVQVADTLTANFHETVVRSVLQSFKDMNIAVIDRDPPVESESRSRTTLRTRIDIDKEVPVVIDTDTIEAWVPSEEWRSEPPPERSPLMLHVLQSLARQFVHFNGYGGGSLLYSLSAADLETIAILEQRDPLAIWYFVHQTADFLKRTAVRGSALSFFNLYRGADHSYYLSDEIIPTFMALGPYGSGELRLEARRIRRQHLLASYSELLPEDIPLLYDSKHLPLDLPRVETTPKLPTFRSVKNAMVSRVADEMGPEIARRLELVVGPIEGDHRGVVLNDAVAYLFDRFEAAIAALSPENLIETLILRSEALLHEVVVHRLSLANRKFHFTDDENFAAELRGELASRSRITWTLRFMIEYVSARPPEGTQPLSLTRFDEIMALAAQMIDFAGMSDAVRFELAEISFSYFPSGRIGFENGPYTAYSHYLKALGLDEITRIDAIREHRNNDEELAGESIFAALDAGVTAEFGVGVQVLRCFFRALAEIGLRSSPSWLFTGRREELLVKLLDHGVDLPTAERLLFRFALEPRKQFSRPPSGFRKEDIYPWRADRKYSHRYRPLVMRPRDGGVDVVFGTRHIMNAWRYLVLQLLSDRYQASAPELKSAMGGLTKERGDLFNRNVGQLIREREDLEVREQVKKFKTEGKTLRPPGDIDVLVIDRKRKRLIALQCKNVEPAHDPHAHAYELKDLLDGDKSIVAKHRAQAAWLRSNLKDVMAALKTDAKSRWRVDAAIVTNARIPAPFLQRIEMPVVSFQELRRMLDTNGGLMFVPQAPPSAS